MSLTLVLLLLALGFFLVLLEVLVFPGVGIPGVAGAVLLAVGVYGAYSISTVTGHYTLAGSFVISVLLLFLSLRRKTWDKMTLSSEVSGRSGEDLTILIKTGDVGEAVTRLNPVGKALIKDQVWEVATRDGFIEESSVIEVIKVESNKIFVKQKH